jgi:hypothetical protein
LLPHVAVVVAVAVAERRRGRQNMFNGPLACRVCSDREKGFSLTKRNLFGRKEETVLKALAAKIFQFIFFFAKAFFFWGGGRGNFLLITRFVKASR